jgi:hypothetical protein
MKQVTKPALFVLAGALLLAASAQAARAQQPAGPRQNDRLYVISGTIRWKTDMGVIPEGPHSSQRATFPCVQFYVAATDPDSGKIIAITNGLDQLLDDGEYHVCSYSFAAPANQRLRVVAGMGTKPLPGNADVSMYFTDPWIGGTRNQPPRRESRGFTGAQDITLTPESRRGVANFEMVYVRRNSPH